MTKPQSCGYNWIWEYTGDETQLTTRTDCPTLGGIQWECGRKWDATLNVVDFNQQWCGFDQSWSIMIKRTYDLYGDMTKNMWFLCDIGGMDEHGNLTWPNPQWRGYMVIQWLYTQQHDFNMPAKDIWLDNFDYLYMYENCYWRKQLQFWEEKSMKRTSGAKWWWWWWWLWWLWWLWWWFSAGDEFLTTFRSHTPTSWHIFSTVRSWNLSLSGQFFISS